MITIAEMFTKAFAEMVGDIDVYNDYDDSLAIAFCGPLELTDEGKKEFADALKLGVRVANGCAVVEINDREDCEKMCKLTRRLFHAAAGYCSDDNYNKWFKEV